MKQRKPNRLKGYDYSQDNLYFVTSCVHNMICCFGDVVESEMILDEYGKIADQQWYWLAEQYPYIVLHEFIVMPNHMHGIIEINRNAVGTGRDLSLPGNTNAGPDLSLPKIKPLSDIMGAYKTTVSKQIHLAGYKEFAWQRSFHDHIIRDQKSYERISNYIVNNSKMWDSDKFFK